MSVPGWRRAVCAVLLVTLTSCGWKVTPPVRPAPPPGAGRVADRAVLVVSDSNVAWTDGRMGETIRDVLMSSGTIGEVYYPVEPRDPPPMRIAVTASGTVDENVGAGLVKSVFIGLLLFLPVGVIRFDDDYRLQATVAVSENGRETSRLDVRGDTEVSHTMFSTIEEYQPAARRAAYVDLAQQIVAHLRDRASAR